MGSFDKITGALGGGDDSGQDNPVEAEYAERAEERVNVDRRAGIIATHYDEIDERQAKQIAEILQNHLTDSDGHRQRDIRIDVEEELELSPDLAERIVWNETTSILVG